jgi:hypothetical protein
MVRNSLRCYHSVYVFQVGKQKNRSMSGLSVSLDLIQLWSIDVQKSGLAKVLNFTNKLANLLILLGAQEGTRTPTELPAST